MEPALEDSYFLNLWRANRDLFYSILASYSFNQISKIINSILPRLKNDYNFWAALYRVRFGKILDRTQENYAETYREELILSKFHEMSHEQIDLSDSESSDDEVETQNQIIKRTLKNPKSSISELRDIIDNSETFRLRMIKVAIKNDDIDLYLFLKQNYAAITDYESHLLKMDDHRDLIEDYLEALDEKQFHEFLSGTHLPTLVNLPTRISQEGQDCNLDLITAKFNLGRVPVPSDYARAVYDSWDADCQSTVDYLLKKTNLLDEDYFDRFLRVLATYSLTGNAFELAEWIIVEYGLSYFNFSGASKWEDPEIADRLYQAYSDQFKEYLDHLITKEWFIKLKNLLFSINLSTESSEELLKQIAQIKSYQEIKPQEHAALDSVIGRLIEKLPSSTVDGIVERSNNVEFKDLIMELIS